MINDWSFKIYDWNGPIESNKPNVRVSLHLFPLSITMEVSEDRSEMMMGNDII
jgi:hypothetical protein